MNEILKEYLANIKEISHVTFDPYGPDVIRIHLIPPKKVKLGIAWVVIINGEKFLTISCGWAILLREFINNINEYSGKEIDTEEIKLAIKETITKVKTLFPLTEEKMLKEDLEEIILTIRNLANGVDVMTPSYQIKEYAKFMKAPHRMDLLVSSMAKNNNWHCNQKCLNCYAANQIKGKEKELDTEDWFKIIDKLKESGVSQLTFTGGEPTLRSDLCDLVAYSSFFVTRLNTNGQLLTKSLCKSLMDASLDNVQITYYSSNPSIHNILVGVDGYNKTVEGIKNSLEAGLLVSLNTPLCTLNKNYKDSIKYAYENFGIRYFTCSALILTGNAVKEKESRLEKEELINILKEALEYTREHDLDLKFTSPGWLSNQELADLGLNIPDCGAGISNMAVSPHGDLIPCQSYLDGYHFGSLLDNDFKSLWNKREMKKFRKQILKLNNQCYLNIKELENEKNC